jgi:hypothetical protein
MQQQMFDQFHQSLVAMIQMFHGLQQEQFGFIRQELDRVHQLTHELHALQAELARGRPSAGEPAIQPQPLAWPAFHVAASLPNRPSPMNRALDFGPSASAPAAAPDNAETRGGPAAVPTNGSGLEASSSSSTPSPQDSAAGAPPTSAPAQSAEEVHQWLAQRIKTIQDERQNRWRRVLNFVLGKGTGQSGP